MRTATSWIAALFVGALLVQVAAAEKPRSRKLALIVKGWDCDH